MFCMPPASLSSAACRQIELLGTRDLTLLVSAVGSLVPGHASHRVLNTLSVQGDTWAMEVGPNLRVVYTHAGVQDVMVTAVYDLRRDRERYEALLDA